MDQSWPCPNSAARSFAAPQRLSGEVTGVPDGIHGVRRAPDRLGVVVFASEETMANLSGEDIYASVSAAGLGAGRHQVRPNVTVPPEVQWLRTDPEVVVVISSQRPRRAGDTSGRARCPGQRRPG